jgi:hypothetical protein
MIFGCVRLSRRKVGVPSVVIAEEHPVEIRGVVRHWPLI